MKATEGVAGAQDGVFWSVLAASLANALVFLELVCYLVFFNFIYQHNKGAVVRSAVRRTRNHANALTMMGQIYLFLLEAVFISIIIITFLLGLENESVHIKDIAVTYKLLEFALLSVAHCYQIPELRLAMSEGLKKRFNVWN